MSSIFHLPLLTIISYFALTLSISAPLWARPNVDEDYLNEVKKEWTLLYVKDGIHVFKKELKGTGITSFRGMGVLTVPMPILFHVVRDVESSTAWTPNLSQKKMVKDISLTEGITYNLNDLPWPVFDRETILHSKLTFEEDKNYFLIATKSVELPEYPHPKDPVRAIVHSCNFIFRPVTGGTFVDLDAHIDPKGDLPHWLINYIQSKWPYNFLKKLEDYAKSKTFTPEKGFVKMLEDFEARQKTQSKAK